MAENAVTEPVAPPSSLSAHRAAKAAAAAGTAAPPADKQASAEPKGETAGESATPKQETQERAEPKPRAKNAEERAAELRAAGRHKEAEKILADDADKKEFDSWKAGKADREREAEELRQLRASRNAPPPSAAAPPAPAPPPAAPVSADDPTEPNFDEQLHDPKNTDKTFGQIQQQFNRDWYKWRREKDLAEERQANQRKMMETKFQTARTKYANFDSILNTPIGTPQNLSTLIEEFDNGLDVVYHLHHNPAERERINGLMATPGRQMAELAKLAESLAAPAAAADPTPEKPKQPAPISRTPPPPRSLGGIIPPEKSGTDKPPSSLSEHRARKAERAS